MHTSITRRGFGALAALAVAGLLTGCVAPTPPTEPEPTVTVEGIIEDERSRLAVVFDLPAEAVTLGPLPEECGRDTACATEDGQIYIDPTLFDPRDELGVRSTLRHELVHRVLRLAGAEVPASAAPHLGGRDGVHVEEQLASCASQYPSRYRDAACTDAEAAIAALLTGGLTNTDPEIWWEEVFAGPFYTPLPSLTEVLDGRA